MLHTIQRAIGLIYRVISSYKFVFTVKKNKRNNNNNKKTTNNKPTTHCLRNAIYLSW